MGLSVRRRGLLSLDGQRAFWVRRWHEDHKRLSRQRPPVRRVLGEIRNRKREGNFEVSKIT